MVVGVAAGDMVDAAVCDRDWGADRELLADARAEKDASMEDDGEPEGVAASPAQPQASEPTLNGQQPPENSGESALKAGENMVTAALQKAYGFCSSNRRRGPYAKVMVTRARSVAAPHW